MYDTILYVCPNPDNLYYIYETGAFRVDTFITLLPRDMQNDKWYSLYHTPWQH